MVGFTGISLLIKGTMLLMNLHRILIVVITALILVTFGCSNEVESKESEVSSDEIHPTDIAIDSITPVITDGHGIPYDILLRGGAPHSTSSILVGDVLGDGTTQLLVSEPLASKVVWIQNMEEHMTFTDGLNEPVRAQAVDIDGDLDKDILVADIGILLPSNDKSGRVVVLRNNGNFQFEPITILDGVGRVACAEGSDLDSDGDMDISVCVFGNEEGKIIWLEQKENFVFEEHLLDSRPGAIHAFPFDPDSDGDVDIAVSLSQDSEEIMIFRNDGYGNFEKEVIFKAPDTYYGMSGIQLSDLDRDGDTDILMTNGDIHDFDLPQKTDPYAYYGVSWFENDGQGKFDNHHEITRHWGAYSVRTADLDHDEDLDLVLVGLQMDRYWPEFQRQDMIWLENDGEENFTSHNVYLDVPLLIAVEVVDIDNDGIPEIFTGTHDYMGGSAGERLVMFNIDMSETGE